MISVIIPLYNGEKTIVKTLTSLINQTYQDFEVIIINDGSTDNSEVIASSYLQKIQSNNRFFFLSQDNQGAPAARNKGFKESKGEFILFCDADAILAPMALEAMLNNLQRHPEASYAYSSFNWGKKLFRLNEFNPEQLKTAPYIHSLSLIRRVDFPVTGWDESIKKFQDWDLWLTMLEQKKIGIWIPQVLFKILPGGTMSSWLPSFAYKLLPFLPVVKKYQTAMQIIKQKHGL
ncbi:MAG TPA: glycosyltransferase family A protein [Candidatus Saccharimonadales bacterium]|nr:glycosyltransferase family A protein [Candidatus Saccharimonadales bacterium]